MNHQDLVLFGQLVREKRKEKGLSQEALAAELFGNPDRKSFISAIENARRNNVSRETTRKISQSLGIDNLTLPISLRWDQSSDIEPHTKDLARAVASHLEMTTHFSLSDRYKANLAAALARLERVTGKPFSLQALLVSFSISLIYISLGAALIATTTPVMPGNISVFSSSIVNDIDPFSFVVFLFAFGICCCGSSLLLLNAGSGSIYRMIGNSIGAICAILMSCIFARLLGGNLLGLAQVMALAAFAGLANWLPRNAALVAMLGGVFAGILASLWTKDPAFSQMTEGVIVWGTLGLVSGYIAAASSRIAKFRIAPSLVSGGTGVLVGIVCVIGFLSLDQLGEQISTHDLTLLLLMWSALPIANAVSDFISLGASHSLANWALEHKNRAVGLLLLILLDLIIAILLVIFTVLTIALALFLAASLFALDIDAYAFIYNSARDPMGSGLWMTIMILSTLIWTYLHFAFVLVPTMITHVMSFLWEEPTRLRVTQMMVTGSLDFQAITMVLFRNLVYKLVWVGVVLASALILISNFEILSTIVYLLLSTGILGSVR